MRSSIYLTLTASLPPGEPATGPRGGGRRRGTDAGAERTPAGAGVAGPLRGRKEDRLGQVMTFPAPAGHAEAAVRSWPDQPCHPLRPGGDAVPRGDPRPALLERARAALLRRAALPSWDVRGPASWAVRAAAAPAAAACSASSWVVRPAVRAAAVRPAGGCADGLRRLREPRASAWPCWWRPAPAVARARRVPPPGHGRLARPRRQVPRPTRRGHGQRCRSVCR
jgi:hypothetical protein